MTRAISWRLYVAWNGTTYVNETGRLIQATGETRLSADTFGNNRGIVDRCTLELANHDGRYSPLNSSGALYSSLQNGGAYHRPMYLSVSVGGAFSRIFTGVIKLPRETPVTNNAIATATIECRGMDELLLGRRISTTIDMLQAANAGGYTEGDVIQQWLAEVLTVTSFDYEPGDEDDTIGTFGAAVIDTGMFPIPWAWLDDESVLEEIWQLAAACGGRFYCDSGGNYRYENAAHWLSHNSSTETITRAGMAGFEPSYADSDLYSEITVETSPRVQGATAVLWEPDEQVVIQPGETRKLTARLKQAAYSVETPVMSAATSGGLDITSSVTVTVVTANVQRVELSITNAAAEAAYLHPFRISGVPLEGGPTQEEKRTSSANGSNGTWWSARGQRSKAMRGNAYIQTQAHAGAVAQMMLHRSEYPRLTYRLRGVPGVPSRLCGNRITIQDDTIMSSSREAFITGISWRLTQNGFTQDIEAIDAASLYPYQSEGYFVVGTNKVGASGTGTARIFY